MAGSHIVLLGDSIFDNGAYTGREPDVVTHLRQLIPSPWRATLCAVDGATTGRLAAQLAGVPADASHLVVAIGGNDALGHVSLLSQRVGSAAEALSLFAAPLASFEASYRAAITAVRRLRHDVTVSTIYEGNLEPGMAVPARVALMLFNDTIHRVAATLGVGVIELRLVCTEPEDYANPIEPSGRGGRKIAQAIARAVGAVDGSSQPAQRIQDKRGI